MVGPLAILIQIQIPSSIQLLSMQKAYHGLLQTMLYYLFQRISSSILMSICSFILSRDLLSICPPLTSIWNVLGERPSNHYPFRESCYLISISDCQRDVRLWIAIHSIYLFNLICIAEKILFLYMCLGFHVYICLYSLVLLVCCLACISQMNDF